MNYPETRNNMIKAWLNYNYSTYSLIWQIKNKDKDPAYFARSWKGESDL